jgi:hypothetical protein
MSACALPPVLARMKVLGFAVFESGVYNLNLFGIRSPERKANQFDDLLGCAYREEHDGPWVVRFWPATCDPGTYWLEHPMRVTGTAILVGDQQCRGAYKVAKHRGQYNALCQRKPVSVYRDADRDNILDMQPETIAEGLYGINIHASSQSHDSQDVNKWSAGCQVHGTDDGFKDMMRLAALQKEHHPTWSTYTYTLLNQWW